MSERWRQVIGYEGHYEVSNLGNVRSVAKTVRHVQGIAHREGMILSVGKRHGYLHVSLWKHNATTTVFVHRLVAMTFVPPFQGETVNHKDFNRENNCVDNLEWVTVAENNRHAVKAGRGPSLAVLHVNSGNAYSSAAAAARALGGHDPSPILRVCRGVLEHYKNNHYKFIEEKSNG